MSKPLCALVALSLVLSVAGCVTAKRAAVTGATGTLAPAVASGEEGSAMRWLGDADGRDAWRKAEDFGEICETAEDVGALSEAFGVRVDVPLSVAAGERIYLGHTKPGLNPAAVLVGYSNNAWIEIQRLETSEDAAIVVSQDIDTFGIHGIVVDVNGRRGLGHDPIDIDPEYDGTDRVVSGTGIHAPASMISFSIDNYYVTVTHPSIGHDALLGIARQIRVGD